MAQAHPRRGGFLKGLVTGLVLAVLVAAALAVILPRPGPQTAPQPGSQTAPGPQASPAAPATPQPAPGSRPAPAEPAASAPTEPAASAPTESPAESPAEPPAESPAATDAAPAGTPSDAPRAPAAPGPVPADQPPAARPDTAPPLPGAIPTPLRPPAPDPAGEDSLAPTAPAPTPAPAAAPAPADDASAQPRRPGAGMPSPAAAPDPAPAAAPADAAPPAVPEARAPALAPVPPAAPAVAPAPVPAEPAPIPDVPAWRAYAAEPPPAADGPLVAVVFELHPGAGPRAGLGQIRLPVSFVLHSDDPDAPSVAAELRRAGQELFVAPSGPQALEPGLPEAEVAARIEAALARVPEAMGLADLTGHVGRDRALATAVVRALMKRGQAVLTVTADARNILAQIAADHGIRHVSADRRLDPEPSEEEMRGALERAAFLARTRGAAVFIAGFGDAALQSLVSWAMARDNRLVRLVPASVVLAEAGR